MKTHIKHQSKQRWAILLLLAALLLFVLPNNTTLLNAQDTSSTPESPKNSIYLPAINANSEVVSSQSAQIAPVVEPPPDDSLPEVPPTPRPDLPVLPEPEHKTQSFSYAEATRGQKLRLGNVDVQLPNDAFMHGLIVAVNPGMGDYLKPPIVELWRGDAMAFVEVETGRMAFVPSPSEKRSQDKIAFDFLIQALGEDKIMEVAHEK